MLAIFLGYVNHFDDDMKPKLNKSIKRFEKVK